jgi:hypothetical protein
MTDQDPSTTFRHFYYLRCAELVENPIMYSMKRTKTHKDTDNFLVTER